jgi:hypothetical protein
MTDKRTQQDAENSNMAKDPDEWVTGDEPMTGAQRSYLKTLSEEAHEPFDENLTKAEASKRIEELQRKTGRGAAGTEESASGKLADLAVPPQIFHSVMFVTNHSCNCGVLHAIKPRPHDHRSRRVLCDGVSQEADADAELPSCTFVIVAIIDWPRKKIDPRARRHEGKSKFKSTRR